MMLAPLLKQIFVTTIFLCLVGCSVNEVSERAPLEKADSDFSVYRYDSIHHPVVSNAGMVVSQNKIASTVGRDILASGGNAVDAAVATGFALAVTLPRAGNIGGSGFMLLHLKGEGKTLALDYRSTAPLAYDLSAYTDADGKIDTSAAVYGPATALVPGTVAGLHEAWKQYGSMPWKALVMPAVKLAKDGIVVSDDLAFVLDNSSPTFRQYPASAAMYMREDGSNYIPGERISFPDLANTLEEIAETGDESFYRGDLAKRFVEAVQKDGSAISLEDLARYKARWREPALTTYRGHKVASMPPPSSGGVGLLQMLNVLEEFDLSAYPQGGVDSVHLLAEVMKRGAANRRASVGDPDFVEVPVAGYLSKKLAKKIAAEISLQQARDTYDITPDDMTLYDEQVESRDTTQYSVVDRFGNAVSNTYTLGYSFGSGYVVPGLGILLDNQLRNFREDDPHHPNSIQPGKRVQSSMTPTIVFDAEGEVTLVTGTPGGSRIPNTVLQVIVNTIDYGLSIAEATARPRIYQSWRGRGLFLEEGFSRDTQLILEARGHLVRPQQTMGSTQSIVVKQGLYFGAADPRRPNALAAGYQLPAVTPLRL